jgi:hypothetical protein
MVKTLPFERKLYTKLYDSAVGNWDIYIPFIEHCWNLLNDDGFGIVITPNKWLSIKYGLGLRKLIYSSFNFVCRLDKIKVFKAGNSPVITGFSRRIEEKNIQIDEFGSNFKPRSISKISKKALQSNNWGILLSDNIELLNKIINNSEKISDYFIVENPFSTSEAYLLKEILEDRDPTEKDFLFINTGTIDPYISIWGQKKTSYLKLKLEKPVINKEKLFNFSKRRYEQSNSPKIIITAMRYFEAYFDSSGNYVAGKSTIIIKEDNNEFSLNYLLPLLNSKLITFFIKGVYSALGIDGGINFSKDLVSDLPIPIFSKSIFDNLEKLSIKIMQENLTKIQLKESEYIDEIDQLVYELYELTEEEIEIIEKASN